MGELRMGIAMRRELMQEYPKGSMPPPGYVAWHEWATAQGLHGLEQKQCERCKLYLFPQEVDEHTCTPPKRKARRSAGRKA